MPNSRMWHNGQERRVIDGLENIHDGKLCLGRHCVIHNPSYHHMRLWDLHWRSDRGIFERLCPHGVGHPDPDQFGFWEETNQEWQAVHGCDFCCHVPVQEDKLSDNAKVTVFDIDFTNYEETEFEGPTKLPEGDYLMRLVSVEQVHVKNENSANFGKPGFLVKLEVVNGPHAGAKIEDRLWVIEKALFRMDQFFSAFGIKVEKTKMQLPVGQVMNRTLTVSVKDGAPFGDKQIVRSEVKKYAHASKSAASEVTTDDDGIDAGGVAL